MTPDSIASEHLLLHDVAMANRNAVNYILARQGLQEVSQPKVLILLDSLTDGSANQQELANALHVSRSTMATSLKTLERKGFVTRHTSQQDSRCKLVSITKKGADTVQRCKETFQMVDRQIYAGFSEDEIELSQQFFRRMLANLHAISGGQADVCGAVSPSTNPKSPKKGGHSL
ncbi:MAG: MarR family transcriptional regulator [Oscillospiraceae bacterium]|nr:MarR family transcriptional regulator [Oscillospiraceae bacterium]